MSIKREIEDIAIRLQREGLTLTAEAGLEAAKDADRYPNLHAAIDWNDASAGHKFRLQQVHRLIMQCKLTIKDGEKLGLDVTRPVRLFPHVRGERGYQSITQVISDHDLHKQYVEQLHGDFVRLQRRLSDVEGLRPKEVRTIRPTVDALGKWIDGLRTKPDLAAAG